MHTSNMHRIYSYRDKIERKRRALDIAMNVGIAGLMFLALLVAIDTVRVLL